ncbi:MAG: hypothetical protein AB1779_02835 [Candidatus Thermoplasmatota archaeon]
MENETQKLSSETRGLFLKAIFRSFLSMAFLIPLILIPFAGPILTITFSPYISGYVGGRVAPKNSWLKLGLLSSLSWSILEIALAFAIINSIAIFETKLGNFDYFFISIILTSNLLFFSIGYRNGEK